jgi:hypothetical protein
MPVGATLVVAPVRMKRSHEGQRATTRVAPTNIPEILCFSTELSNIRYITAF